MKQLKYYLIKNKERNREEALEHLEERKVAPAVEETNGGGLLQALAKPVE